MLELNYNFKIIFYLVLGTFTYILRHALIYIRISGAKNIVPFIRTSGIHGDGDDLGVFQYGNTARMNVLRGISSHFDCVYKTLLVLPAFGSF